MFRSLILLKNATFAQNKTNLPSKTPHIAVNTRLLLPGKLEGISRFGYEVLKRMVENHPEARFSFFFDRVYDPAYIFGDNVTGYVIPPQARHPYTLACLVSFYGELENDSA